jgi:uncharacterized glyoxalase superfamily protein PhnB
MPELIVPILRYRDAHAAIRFLCDAFGFVAHLVVPDGDRVVHAQLRLGDGWVMLASAGGDDSVVRITPGNGAIYVVVADPDAHLARARAAGAEIHVALADQPHGSREYGARDPEGYEWYFGTYRPGAS